MTQVAEKHANEPPNVYSAAHVVQRYIREWLDRGVDRDLKAVNSSEGKNQDQNQHTEGQRAETGKHHEKRADPFQKEQHDRNEDDRDDGEKCVARK
jgi:hypothetical protein